MKVVEVDTQNTDVRGDDENHLVALLGVKDIIVVKRGNVTIVAQKNEKLIDNLLDLVVQLGERSLTIE